MRIFSFLLSGWWQVCPTCIYIIKGIIIIIIWEIFKFALVIHEIADCPCWLKFIVHPHATFSASSLIIPNLNTIYSLKWSLKTNTNPLNSPFNAEFDTFADLKHDCVRAALLDIFEFIPEKIDSDRYSLKCESQGCSWHLYAVPVFDSTIWRVRMVIQINTCHGLNHLGHANINEEFISIEILPNFARVPRTSPKLSKEEFGITINYSKAYHTKERALKPINCSHKEAYGYLQNIAKKSNFPIQEVQ